MMLYFPDLLQHEWRRACGPERGSTGAVRKVARGQQALHWNWPWHRCESRKRATESAAAAQLGGWVAKLTPWKKQNGERYPRPTRIKLNSHCHRHRRGQAIP